MVLSLSDQGVMRRTLTMLNLVGMSEYEFVAFFGSVSHEYPLGNRLWDGMAALLVEFVRRGGRESPRGYNGFQRGFFTASEPFSSLGAMQPLDSTLYRPGAQYPAFFYINDDGAVRMWCQHILARQSRGWQVHVSRIQLMAGRLWINERCDIMVQAWQVR